jgi:F0F1-type ATP synthase membrane subunit c/vacuolar-type H+-ATPase subunit K
MLNPTESIAARVKPLKIIWFALMVGIASFYLVVWFAIKGEYVTPVQLPVSLLAALGVIFLVPLLLAPYVRRRLETAPRGAGEEEITRRWQTGWIVGQALKESTGLGGLVLAMMAGSTTWALGFTVASVLSMIMTPPWESDLLRRIQRGTGSDATALRR